MSVAVSLLQAQIARIEGRALSRGGPVTDALSRPWPTGHDGIDAVLGGGLMRGRVHEVFAAEPDAGSGAGFCAVLAHPVGTDWLWLREDLAERRMGRLDAAGLAEIGARPERLVLGVLPDALAVLRAASDALRCRHLGLVVVELWGDPRAFDLTASRRLALAAEASGVTALMLRVGGRPAPGAAQTRWRVAAAPSADPGARAPGSPSWDLELVRQRTRPGIGRWQVEWDRDRARLCDQPPTRGFAAGDITTGNVTPQAGTTGAATSWPPLSGAVVPLSADRSAHAHRAGLRRAG